MNDFEYVNELFCRLVEHEKKYGQHALNQKEKIVLAVWHTTGLIENGGLQNFFIWEEAKPEIADYFEEIGMAEAAHIVREFFLLLPAISFDDLSSSDRDEVIEKNIEKISSEVDILNQKLYQLIPRIEVNMAAFIRDKDIGN